MTTLTPQKQEEELKPLSPRHKAIKRIAVGMFNFWLIAVCYLFFLFGALQEKFQYNSTLVQEVNKTLGMTGATVVETFIKAGAKRPDFWIVLFFLVIAISFYYNVFSEIKDNWNTIKTNSNLVKGGKKKDDD